MPRAWAKAAYPPETNQSLIRSEYSSFEIIKNVSVARNTYSFSCLLLGFLKETCGGDRDLDLDLGILNKVLYNSI